MHYPIENGIHYRIQFIVHVGTHINVSMCYAFVHNQSTPHLHLGTPVWSCTIRNGSNHPHMANARALNCQRCHGKCCHGWRCHGIDWTCMPRLIHMQCCPCDLLCVCGTVFVLCCQQLSFSTWHTCMSYLHGNASLSLYAQSYLHIHTYGFCCILLWISFLLLHLPYMGPARCCTPLVSDTCISLFK